MRRLLPALLALLGGCELAPPPSPAGEAPRVVVSEVMADPRAVPDEQGEWIELYNAGDVPAELRGWRLDSRGDAGHTIGRSLVVAPGEAVVLARSGDPGANGGVRADYAYGADLTLANGADRVVLRDASGARVDSVAWSGTRRGASWTLRDLSGARAEVGSAAWAASEEPFGRGDRGSPGRVEVVGSLAVETQSAHEGQPGPVYRNHLEFGVPRDATPADDHLMEKRQYALSYNPRLNVPNWVSWNLNRTHFGDAPRSSTFLADPDLPARFTRVVSSDYTGSGYSRGHLVRSEERTATPEENASTFLLTNVLPQHQDLNAGPWLDLERHLQREAVERDREVYLVAGGIFPPEPETLGGRGKVAVPTHTWKIAVILPAGRGLTDVKSASDLRVIAVSMPNVGGIAERPWTDYRTTVDALEEATGYDFLDRLPDEIEAEVERGR